KGVALGLAVNRWQFDRDAKATFTREHFDSNGFRYTVEEESSDLSLDGWNANLGVMWRPSPRWTMGAVYKSDFSLSGDERVESSAGAPTDATISIKWPESVGVGVSLRPRESFLVAVDLTHSWWSKGIETFEDQQGRSEVFFPSRTPTTGLADN